MITPFTGMTIVAGFLACTSFGTCLIASYERRWKEYWYKEATDCLDERDDAKTALAILAAECDKASARADHYASSWGRVMKLLRIAQKANKELRDAQMRREMADNIDRMAA